MLVQQPLHGRLVAEIDDLRNKEVPVLWAEAKGWRRETRTISEEHVGGRDGRGGGAGGCEGGTCIDWVRDACGYSAKSGSPLPSSDVGEEEPQPISRAALQIRKLVETNFINHAPCLRSAHWGLLRPGPRDTILVGPSASQPLHWFEGRGAQNYEKLNPFTKRERLKLEKPTREF